MIRDYYRLAVLAVLAGAAHSVAAPLTADEILDKINAVWQGESFHAVMSLEITLGGQTKSHRLEVWTLGESLALVRVLEPTEDANSGYLLRGDEMWYYAPGIGAIALPSVALGDALFGAGPSLNDLSRGTLSNEYAVVATTTPSGYFLCLTPRPDTPVVFGKIELWANHDFILERMLTYDQRGDVLQSAFFMDVVDQDDRKLATTLLIEDAWGDRTVQRIEWARFDPDLDEEFFQLETFLTWEKNG